MDPLPASSPPTSPDQPLFRSGLGILVRPPLEGGQHCLIYPDMEKLGAEAALRKMWDWFPGYRMGSSVLPILDWGSDFELEPEPAYPSSDAYDKATHDIEMSYSGEDLNRWWDQYGLDFWGPVQWYGPRVRYKEKVYHLKPEGSWIFRPRTGPRTLFDPDTNQMLLVHRKSYVDLEDNARCQVLFEGQVCCFERDSFRSTGRLVKPDGSVVAPFNRSLAEDATDKPVGTPVLYRKRVCHLKWTTRPYALVYDPKIGADRKVPLRSVHEVKP